ncbi:hypothetical protein M5K25_021801 [Dendrobium thyrsiflorum]|uniref:Uncharacterized protein n=1 Tax=Dendrobium thyrsiflorum TaxID=117978 RepID=A0ABD0UB34_DENTH
MGPPCTASSKIGGAEGTVIVVGEPFYYREGQTYSTEKQTHLEYGGELPRQTNEYHHSSSNVERNDKGHTFSSFYDNQCGIRLVELWLLYLNFPQRYYSSRL